MEVIIRQDEAAAAKLVAGIIEQQLRAKPDLVLGLATGRTMERVYSRLADLHRDAGLDFSGCHTFNLDEYIGLPPSHPSSYRRYMDENLFNKVNIARENTHLPDGMADDLKSESERYEQTIRECGGIDVQLLGMGRDGHIGFNEPLSALMSRTREKALTPSTIRENSTLFEHPEQMPRRALTMGVGTILDSRRCLVLVTGYKKAKVLAQAVEGPVTAMVTASALQLHPKCTVIVDEPAAASLEGTDYYRWVFENEPEWQEFRA